MNLLPIHIIAGVMAIISGFIAVFVIKGMWLHRRAGIVFVYSLVILGLTGAVIGVLRNQPGNVVAGMLAAYLVITGLLAVRRSTRDIRLLEGTLMVVGFAIGALSIKAGIDSLNGTGPRDGVPPGMRFFMGSVILLAAAGDLRVLVRGQLTRTHRVARHLWRMCFALFVASGSFFLGQAQVFPKSIRIYPLLAIPALLPLALLVYWLIRVRFSQWYRRSVRVG